MQVGSGQGRERKLPAEAASAQPYPAHIRRRWRLEGVVQGVGFRPFVATIARRAGLTGFCGNDERGVFLEAEGPAAAIDEFRQALFTELPALSRIINHSESELVPLRAPITSPGTGFEIVPSRHSDSGRALLPPDTALCPDCRREFFDPADRRYLYPFISCTNCGPRLSIITELPYDRPRTTMRDFPMCTPCETEYTAPADRRFHAQPVSCFDCGPRLSLVQPGAGAASASGGKASTREEVLALFARVHGLLDDGAILAVKGIGGFHLVCDARRDEAVARLRQRKRRPDKPLAVMVPDLDAAREVVELGEAEADLLASPEAPIVIAAKKTAAGAVGTADRTALSEDGANVSALSEGIAPGLEHFGVMLPYSGIHLLLCDRPLVVTSGNISGEPVCTGNEEALAKLGRIADAFVLHDRDIHVPVEDSVFVGTAPSRRSRGFAPLPIAVSTGTDSPADLAVPPDAKSATPTVFATGGELKNTFALAHDDLVHISAHIGDMGSWASQRAYERAAEQLLSIRDARPELVVCDLHPGYATTSFAERFADDLDIDLLAVQHHWAHALSLLAEHRLLRPGTTDSPGGSNASGAHGNDCAIVAALDGTGYGTDATIWGGEILRVSLTGPEWDRVWHFPTFPLVGGDRAVTHPWRLALGLTTAWGLPSLADSLFDALTTPSPASPSEAEIDLVKGQIEGGVGTVQCSSLGRIFDAAAALILPRWRSGDTISYEAQAAMELEAAATRYARAHPDCFDAAVEADVGGGIETVATRAFGMPDPGAAAFEFHRGFAGIVGKQLAEAATSAGTSVVGVSGGCANNALLIRLLEADVARRGYELLQHRSVPPGDGGLSLGQAMAGRLLRI